MAIILHEGIFRELAAWNPARLQNAGGIVLPVLEMLHDYACHKSGVPVGTTAMLYVVNAEDEYVPLLFGSNQWDGDNQRRTVRLDDYVEHAILRTPDRGYLTFAEDKNIPAGYDFTEVHDLVKDVYSELSQRPILVPGLPQGERVW